MKFLISLIVLLGGSIALAQEYGGAEPILPEAKFFAESIEFNVATQKYQIFSPYYQSKKDGAVSIWAGPGPAAHLCKFFDMQGGRLLQDKTSCAGSKLLVIAEDGAYVVQVVEEKHCGYAITAFECDPIETKLQR